ncbi:MAG TPA: 4-alpha-glucanotransferase [Candidatus Poseidoniales archaeon]|nr:MAG: 4-alpha-glucanotransferase [Euryarchaeota archaeon]HIA90648.1 4-alpha-glucanotransferase [Candidatus Poseidoniales archaeon]HIO94944.1 4-alpha-glucanotransferase [Candidatus Poseidoniales archaeon]
MRGSGILCHLTSLPSESGKGCLGHHALRFLDVLQSTGQSVWQMLPIHPPDQYDSPYASTSAFAGDTNLLDPDIRIRPFTRGGLLDFRKLNPWVHDWALYQIAKQQHGGAAWSEWEEPIRRRETSALEEMRGRNLKDYWRHIGEQQAFEQQWSELRRAAEERGVELVGDLPFFVAGDSADVWANQHLFQLDESGQPIAVSGVPPDAFSDDGQYWGTPLFAWNEHRSDGFSWWQKRVEVALKRFHRLRIDHFRAVEEYWSIPANSDNARYGEWKEGPGDELLTALCSVAGEGRLIAEDLGIIPATVIEMRRRHNLPGMAVLHFAFDGSEKNPHLPGNITEDVICYTGTHDNDTTVGWYSSIEQNTRENIARALSGESTIDKGERPIHRRLIRAALASRAATTILALQDVMGLDSSARMNTPGTREGNWNWQFMWTDIAQNDLNWLAAITEATGRWQEGRFSTGGAEDGGSLGAGVGSSTGMGDAAAEGIGRTRGDVQGGGGDGKPGEVVAYFSAEIGLRSDLPTYSGGLGVLAGDHIKAAADKGLDFVAVTLLYRRGYGRQHLDGDGRQTETFPAFDPRTILEDTGIDISIPLDGKSLYSRIWKYTVESEFGGEVDVLFLDTAHPDNSPIHSALGSRLYGGGDETRIRQEYLLGIGGIRALKALGIWPLKGIHLNEGHCAFAGLEMLRQGWSREQLSRRCLFTSHTPVPAGHDHFAWDEVEAVMGEGLPDDLRPALGGATCSMSHLAAHLAGKVNAVSKLNAEVAGGMFPTTTVHPVTNGVHHLTWVGPAMQEVYDEFLPEWRSDPAELRKSQRIPVDNLISARRKSRAILRELVEVCTGVKFDDSTLTIGFARRFATYKRADLVFRNIARLSQFGRGKIQFVFAGKAHPKDEGGKQLIANVISASKELEGKIPVAFLEDYSMDTGMAMTNGVDIWLNCPVRPMEASGTSGMKASISGVPNCSILDGWWPEACDHGVNGWAIGEAADERDDERDAEAVLDVLENEVLPVWQAGEKSWLELVRGAISAGAGFSAKRMLDDYCEFYADFS